MRGKPPPAIVLLSANSGSGHAKAADNLKCQLRDSLKDWEIIHENVCDFSSSLIRWSIERLWKYASTLPFLREIYSHFYSRLVSSPIMVKISRIILSETAESLNRRFIGTDVRIVVAFHPAAVIASSVWKEKSEKILIVVCTDYIVHNMHFQENVDSIFYDIRSSFLPMERLLDAGAKLHCTGLPIDMSPQVRSGVVGFDVLVTFGASGLRGRDNLNLVLSLLASQNLSGIVVCGRNIEMFDEAEKLICQLGIGDRLSVVGHVENMAHLIASARVVIGKPGGLTTGEAMAHGKPFVIIDWLPGQEEHNALALVKSGLGFVCERGSGSRGLEATLRKALAPGLFRIENRRERGLEAIADCIVHHALGSTKLTPLSYREV